MEKTSRNITLDIAKGLLIVLVVLGHSINVNYGFGTWINKFIYSFHMPAFFVISGYLVYYSLNDKEIIWAMKKSLQRFFPIIIFGCLFYILSYFSHLNGGYLDVGQFASENNFFEYWWRVMLIDGMGNGLWFFWTLIWCGLIVSIAHLISRKYCLTGFASIFVYLFICAVICCVKIVSGHSFGVEEIQWCLPFFVGGYLIAMNLKYFMKYSSHILIVMSVVFIGLCFLGNFGNGAFNASAWLLNLSSIDLLCKILSAVCGTAFIVSIARLAVMVFCVRSILAYLGKHSLDIYVIHVFFLSMAFMQIGIGRVAVGTILSIIVCVVSGYILRQIWFVRAFAFGDWIDINRVRCLNRIFVSISEKLARIG